MRKVFLAGHSGMVGGAIFKKLSNDPSVDLICATRRELNLLRQDDVFDFLRLEKPDEVILAAAKVGGIHANDKYPADFIYQNLQIQNNVIHGSHLADIQKLLFLGSSCIYPKHAMQPMRENSLLTSKLEPTNEPYAIAKIAGKIMCDSYKKQFSRDYRTVMPTNLYGPGDNYHPQNSHVIPGLIQRFHKAKIEQAEYVTVWGTGSAKREFLFVDDMADACLFVHDLDRIDFTKKSGASESHINIGSGEEVTIKELAKLIQVAVGYKGSIKFDASKPDGTPRKLLDSGKLARMGWKAQTTLQEGLRKTYEAYMSTFVD